MRTITLIALPVLLFFAYPSAAQCNADELSSTSIKKLADGFNFLKSYKVSGEGNKEMVEYSYVFTKGTQYMVTLSDQNDANSIVVTIFDSERRKVATNRVNGNILSGIAYPCNATGIYYLQYTFEGGPRCGGSALGFRK